MASKSTLAGRNSSTNGETYTSAHLRGEINGQVQTDTNGSTGYSESYEIMPQVPVAICGMDLRLPGGICKDSDLYEFLVNKRDARQTIPSNRFNIESYYDKSGKPGSISTRHGYFIDAELAHLDISMFPMTPAEAIQLDPAQRLLLEVTREALESAGEADFRGKCIGTYVGDFTQDWEELHAKDVHDFAPYQLTGKSDFVLCNRLAFEYDLRGPSMTIKGACSATALAVHEAVLAIRAGSCSSAIVAGANLTLTPQGYIGLTSQMTLSPDGSCKTFDASANGFARGESVGALYIKRLDAALRDGNPVRAIIRAAGANADGIKGSFTMPNARAHEDLIRQTYAAAGLNLSDTRVVECHGTGTAVGDPEEVSAIAKCFGQHGAYITSVKPNLGHGEGASAITSIAKAVLSLENRTILPNIKFHTPNPKIPWEAAKLKVPVEPIPWPEAVVERISLNSFGISGSNVHLVLDSAASFGIPPPFAIPRSLTLHSEPKLSRKSLLLFSGANPQAVNAMVRNYEIYLKDYPERIESVAFTLASRRERLKVGSFCVVDNSGHLKPAPPVADQGVRRAAFIFTGQGAQWVCMARELMHDYSSFVDNIRKLDEVLQSLEHAPSWSLWDTLMGLDDNRILATAERAQPICTALQIALVDLLAEFGIRPAAVVGHSSGEIAAAYAAGALSKKEAIITAFYRGYICSRSNLSGGMVAVGLGREALTSYLTPGLNIACENSASSVTLSGDLDALEKVMVALRQDHPEVLVRKLQVTIAYHSDHMQAVGEIYASLLSPHLSPKPPQVPFFSSVDPNAIRGSIDFGPKYWQQNMENPVLFRSAVTQLVKESGQELAHLEIGPHSALAGPLRQIYKEIGDKIPYASVLSRGKEAAETFLGAIGQLYCFGLNPKPLLSMDAVALPDLPSYPWQYDGKYWAESRVMSNWRFRKYPSHDLLGTRTPESSDLDPTWRNNIKLTDVPWLQDHCVGNDIVFPAAAYIAMAGEAIIQLTESSTYTLRDIHISSAMVIPEDGATEVMTNLRKKQLTTTLESKWYEFSVASYRNGTWTRHCWGLVTSGCASTRPAPTVKTFSKAVSSNRWYKTMARIGLNYGPRFIGLEQITASVTDRLAASVIVDKQEQESAYPLHPATLDLILQSWTIAAVRGEYRNLTQLFLPTFIEEFYVGCGVGQKISVNTKASGLESTAHGESYGVVESEVIFVLKGFKGTRMDNSTFKTTFEPKAMQLEWKLDIEFAPLNQLMRPARDSTEDMKILERMYVLCTANAQEKLAAAKCSLPHFEQYRTWLAKEFEQFKESDSPLVPHSVDIVEMDSENRQREIMSYHDQHGESSPMWPVIEAMWRSYDRMIDIIEGRAEHLDVFLEDGLLPKFYDWTSDLSEIHDLFETMGHSNPQLRILEIGAGTGGTTARVLTALTSDLGEPLYQNYTVTDISAGFFSQTRERFKEYEGLEYKVLDVSKDPLGQGFKAGDYDLIIASNVLHATPSLVETLTNCRKLLHSNGYLFMQELSPIGKWIGMIMGLFAGWWEGVDDGRPDQPGVSVERWDAELRKAGFGGIHTVVLDHDLPYYNIANIIARPTASLETFEDEKKGRITLLTPTAQMTDFANTTKNKFCEAGYDIDHIIWGEEPPADQDLISILDMDSPRPLLKDVTAEDLATFVQLVDHLAESVLLWLTPPAQINCKDPNCAHILGVSRTIRAELAMDFATLELENTSTGAVAAVLKVFQKLQCQRKTTEDFDLDTEYSYTNGEIYLSRFHWFPVKRALAESAAVPDFKYLSIGQRGMIHSLEWRGDNFHPLGANEVQVRMTAVGLNFLDLAIATNIVDTPETLGKGYNALGAEGVGYITKVGSSVDRFKPGDRVMTIGVDCAVFATELQRPAMYCVRVPDGLSDEDAAGMCVPYLTVLWSFLDKADLRKGQTVLIHSAAGGVGIAAIHVARWLGAEIYVTVGAQAKVDHLVNKLGVPRERIFHSRDDTFVDGILTATNGIGVDVVLNSLSGELLHASWKCVAPGGCMLEIGKRDFLGRAQLAMHLFEENRTYFGLDLSRLAMANVPAMMRLLAKMTDLYEEGHIYPLLPTTVFDAERVQDAFLYMSKGLHMGRIVIRLPKDDTLTLAPSIPEPTFKPDASYLLIGGLGGLGQSVISWMASSGAQQIMVLSRSAGKSAADQAFLKEMKEKGCTVHCFQGDVTDSDFVQNTIQQAPTAIAGVMQMAMVLRDIGFINMDHNSWVTAIHPKVQGTWNLHQILPKDLDFFVLFSSNSGILASYGQSNYAAANSYLDAFVQFRHSLGLPASVIDICAIGDVGFVSQAQVVARRMEDASMILTSEQEFLFGLQLAIIRSSSQYITQPFSPLAKGYSNPSHITLFNDMDKPITDHQNGVVWKRDPRISIYRNIEGVSLGTEGQENLSLRRFLASLASEPEQLEQPSVAEFFAQEIATRVRTFLTEEDAVVDTSRTLNSIGIDSLVTIEIRNWWKQAFATEVSVLELRDGGSLLQLGELAVQRLKDKHSNKRII